MAGKWVSYAFLTTSFLPRFRCYFLPVSYPIPKFALDSLCVLLPESAKVETSMESEYYECPGLEVRYSSVRVDLACVLHPGACEYCFEYDNKLVSSIITQVAVWEGGMTAADETSIQR